ncbi:hypothetical protein BDZ88DRAFT_423995 [Geranomyces variabilis]|nr:hypothetical protein BDZ88DRAFT_423995 [Geranomyces variabilis]KAJ3137712.1 hypothetical protein HDU90_001663 [Geranomyces variabilis]
MVHVPTGVYPLVAVMGGAAVGVVYFLGHKAAAPDVVWSRQKNPFPWQHVQPDQTSKLYDHSGKFKKWHRLEQSNPRPEVS